MLAFLYHLVAELHYVKQTLIGGCCVHCVIVVSVVINKNILFSYLLTYLLTGEEDPIADYDETSIRYRGRTNPSRTFRLLQSATGSDSDSGEQAYSALWTPTSNCLRVYEGFLCISCDYRLYSLVSVLRQLLTGSVTSSIHFPVFNLRCNLQN